jgi:hypothetical protein
VIIGPLERLKRHDSAVNQAGPDSEPDELIDPEYSEICEIVAGLRPGPPAAEAGKGWSGKLY